MCCATWRIPASASPTPPTARWCTGSRLPDGPAIGRAYWEPRQLILGGPMGRGGGAGASGARGGGAGASGARGGGAGASGARGGGAGASGARGGGAGASGARGGGAGASRPRLGGMYGPDVTFLGVPRADLADP